MMKLPRPLAMFAARTNQAGAASVAIAMLMMFILVAAVLAIQNMSGSSAVDSEKSEEQVAALFLAESGLERAKGLLDATGSFTDTKCTVIANGGAPLSLGRGTFSSTAVSCDNSAVCGGNCSNGTCGSCTVTVTGTIGNSNRTITRVFTLKQNTGGTFCNTANPLTPDCTNSATLPPTNALPTWKSTVTNTSGSSAIAFFNMAASRQGNWSAATCSPATCQIVWSIDAQNSLNSVASMGNAVPLASGESKTVYQTLNLNKNVVENGALFPGPGTLPLVAGTYSYWDDTTPSGGGSKTVGKSGDLSGQTNNGTENTVTTCTTVANNSAQACNNWCVNADTLVIGMAASADATTDKFNSVTFNTGGSNPQNIPLVPVGTRFPAASTVGAPPNVFAEIRYAHNPAFTSDTDVKSGSSFTGSVGGTFTGWIANNSKVLTITVAPTGGPLVVGDSFIGMDTGTTLVSFGTVNPDGTGTYNVDTNSGSGKQGSDHGTSGSPISMQFSNNVLTVTTAPTGQSIAANDKIFSGVTSKGTIQPFLTGGTTGTGGMGTYNLSARNIVASGTIQTDGKALSTATNTLTLYLPASDPMSSSLYVVVSTGQGQLIGGTTVPLSLAASSLNGVQLSARPTTPLSGATLKGGTFAFFDQTAATTQFTVTRSGAVTYWAAGFMCLSGVTQTPTETTSGPQTATGSTWHEVVK